MPILGVEPRTFLKGIDFKSTAYTNSAKRAKKKSLYIGESSTVFFLQNIKMGQDGFEPTTLRLSSAHSNQLSYKPTNTKKKLTNKK